MAREKIKRMSKEEVEKLLALGCNPYPCIQLLELSDEEKLELKKLVWEKEKKSLPGIKIYLENDLITVEGKTFPIKDVLKKLGFRWNPGFGPGNNFGKCWWRWIASVEEAIQVLESLNKEVSR